MGTTLLTWAVLLLGETTDDAMAPWASNHHPTDVARRHVHEITARRLEYVVVQGGTMDGRNCRSPQGVWQPFEQTWESNRSVRMENLGTTDVVNPWLSNGQNDFRSLDRLRTAGKSDYRWIEAADIVLHQLWRVALRVDRDEQGGNSLVSHLA